MNGTSVSNGTHPSPISISQRSFRNFPESFGKWKMPLVIICSKWGQQVRGPVEWGGGGGRGGEGCLYVIL